MVSAPTKYTGAVRFGSSNVSASWTVMLVSTGRIPSVTRRSTGICDRISTIPEPLRIPVYPPAAGNYRTAGLSRVFAGFVRTGVLPDLGGLVDQLDGRFHTNSSGVRHGQAKFARAALRGQPDCEDNEEKAAPSHLINSVHSEYAFLGPHIVFVLSFRLPGPRDWVPARWTWTDPATLDLLTGTPVNCVLVEWSEDLQDQIAAFSSRAGEKGIASLAVIRPGADPAKAARDAVNAKLQGIVLEGDFPANTADRVRDVLAGSKAVIVELTSRRGMKLNGDAPIIGTYQGVWPGIQVLENGEAKAGPTGSPWIDTNSGFIRAVRSVTSAAVWLGNMPPEKTVITAQRYAQAVSDAEMVGARWVIALDADFAGRLRKSDPAARKDWKLITDHLKFFEDHPDWRSLQPLENSPW